MNIDVIGNAVKFISRESDTQAEKSLYHSTGLMSSFYESETIREFSGQRAVSTEEILRVADEQDIDILFLSGANLDELDSSGLSAQNKTDIKKYIEEGNYVTVPAEEVTVDSWTGTGYIVYDPASGMSTYIINNNLHGGSMVSWVGLSLIIDDVNLLEIHNKITATDPIHSGNGTLKGNLTNGSSTGLIAQDDAARILVENGYDVEILPEINGGNTFGIQPESNPDFRINNKAIFDCYAPELQKGVDYTIETKKIDSFTNKVCKQIGIKTKKQASRIVMNLKDIPKNLYEPMYNRIIGKTAEGQDLQYLDELIVILKDEKIERWFLR